MSQDNQAQRKRKPLAQLPADESIGARKRTRTSDSSNELVPTCSRRAGTINYMILKNFMCHSLLEVNFTENNISMVIGKNGSGKSALLTGLIVGLGGRASLTNRGNSVKGFVKVGKPSGSVEIQLCNEGPMAYKPRIYGKHITIIRNLSASGGGSYQVKSERGDVISKQATEVINITTNLNIQVDNPICLLTQETSRNFLNSNDPKNKFTLFMRATKLEMLDTTYKTTLANKRECERILADKKKNFKYLEEEIHRLEAKIDGHQSIVSLKEREIALKIESLWAQVRDDEEELAEKQENMDKIVKKFNSFEANCNKKAQDIEQTRNSKRDYERQIAELKEQLEIQKRPQNESKRELEELQNQYNQTKRRKQAYNIEIDSKVKDVEYLQREISNANENMSKVEQQKKEKMKNLEALQNKLKSLDDHLETVRNDLFQIKGDISRKRDDEGNLISECRQVAHQIEREESSLKAFERESGNTLMVYGRNVPRVKQMIMQHKNQFQHEPKGPLGSYMKLKDKTWAVAIEGFLGRGILNAFTVDNNKDCKLLQQIFAKCLEGEAQPTIITSRFLNKKHDVRKNLVQAPRDCISLYDAVIIDDPVVFNCVIDQMGPENILLIPNGERARELMSDRNKVPRNCREALTIKGDKYYPDPHYKTYASNYHKARYLQVDTKEHLQFLQENLTNLRNNKQAIQNQLTAIQEDMNNQNRKQKELEDKIRKVASAKQEIRRRYDEISSAVEPEAHDLNTLENELQDIKRILIEKNALLGQVEEEMREIKTKINAQEETISKMKKASKSLEDRLWPLQQKIQESESKERQQSINDDFEKKRLEEYRRRVENAKSEFIIKQNEVESKALAASKRGRRPTQLRRVPEIARELQDIKKSIDRIETENDDITEVKDRYQELRKKHDTVVKNMTALGKSIHVLNVGVDRRKIHYKLTENYFVTFIKHSFKKILEFRQFKGSIDINLEQKKLELIVIPQQGSQGRTTTSNLSGGERSFSTVAFLYSLWQCMDFPFYFLDEFDVYMDKLNRTKVIHILLRHANSKPDLQFVFLTPQDVSFITQNVSILRLEDPERLNA